MEILGFWFL